MDCTPKESLEQLEEEEQQQGQHLPLDCVANHKCQSLGDIDEIDDKTLLMAQQEEALNAIKELDAILDYHDTISSSSNNSDLDFIPNHHNAIENNMDMDIRPYTMNQCYRVPWRSDNELNRNNSSDSNRCDETFNNWPTSPFQRQQHVRKTFSCISDNKFLDNILKKYPMKECLNMEEFHQRPTTSNSISSCHPCPSQTPSQSPLAVSQHSPASNCSNEEITATSDLRFASKTTGPLSPYGDIDVDTNRLNDSPLASRASVSYFADFMPANLIPNTTNDCNQFHDDIMEPDTSQLSHNTNTSITCVETSCESGEFSDSLHELSDREPNNTNESINSQTVGCLQADNSTATATPAPKRHFNSIWPHSYSRMIALTSCTLGLFNICRFAILTINYGGNFLIQFFFLSLLFGIPFLWLQMCLGAKIRAGPIAMWKISPICSGVGISLVLVQYITTIYSSIVIVWTFSYLYDLIKLNGLYPWLVNTPNCNLPTNLVINEGNCTQGIPDYFNRMVLQRWKYFKLFGVNSHLDVNDRSITGLIILWSIVFVVLCKGLKSFGKILFILGLLPLLTLATITGMLLYVVDVTKLQSLFNQRANLNDFLINSKSWVAAAQETFLTWCFLGPSVIAIMSRINKDETKVTLRRDAILVVLITCLVLCLAALIGLCSIQIVNQAGYIYVPGSFETTKSSLALHSLKTLSETDLLSYPEKLIPHYSTFVGEVYYRPTVNRDHSSGYQVMRFITELFPGVAYMSADKFSWQWSATVFTVLIVCAINQLCAMWKPITSSIGNSTNIIVLSCMSGLLLSMAFVTEYGIVVVHYIDYVMGGAWFVPILWTAQVLGVFLIRGRPYNGDDLVNDLKLPGILSTFLALAWNVFLPLGFLTLAAIEFKSSASSQLFLSKEKSSFSYAANKTAAVLQIGLLLLIPFVAVVQILRYLTCGPPDIFDRIQLLYRPAQDDGGNSNLRNNRENPQLRSNIETRTTTSTTNSSAANNLCDSPPKYTPPPSYTTATGARLAKLFHQSFRHSIRRFLGEHNNSLGSTVLIDNENGDQRSLPSNSTISSHSHAFVPLSDVNPSISERIQSVNSDTDNYNINHNHHHILPLQQQKLLLPREEKQLEQPALRQHRHGLASFRLPQINKPYRRQRPYTAEDVVSILRSSMKNHRRSLRTINHMHNNVSFRSIENLVANAEPLGVGSSMSTNTHLANRTSSDMSEI